MVTVLEECNSKEQHSVVCFLWAKGLDAKVIHKKMFPVYGRKCLSRKVVHNWVKKFSQGHLKVVGAARPRHPVEIVINSTVQWVEQLIRVDRRITMDSAATALAALGCTHGLAYNILHEHLEFLNV
jgi:hypothetical protein